MVDDIKKSNNDESTRDEIDGLKADIELNANKLVSLLDNSTMPQEVKESCVDLLPLFSLEQIERLINILEAKYLDEKTEDIDGRFKKEMQVVVDEYRAHEKEIDDAFIKQINVISQNNV